MYFSLKLSRPDHGFLQVLLFLHKGLFGLGLELALDHHEVLGLELLLVGGAGVLVHLPLPAAELLPVLPSLHHRLQPGKQWVSFFYLVVKHLR